MTASAQEGRYRRPADPFDSPLSVVGDVVLDTNLEIEEREARRSCAIDLVQAGEALAAQGDHRGAGEKFQAALDLDPPSDTPVYVWIEAGAFQMGSPDESTSPLPMDDGFRASADEMPQHEVWLDGYWILRIEVTNGQYARCVAAGACSAPSNSEWDAPENVRWPVTNVNWLQATAYAKWVGGSLPTEAQWEKACRGADARIYPWGNITPNEDLLNFSGNIGRPVKVGTYDQGGSGLYDMAGNAWEWTFDWHADDYYAESPVLNPRGPVSGERRTLRGGSFNFLADWVRCAARLKNGPGFSSFDSGFRVVSPGS